jgi:stage V sporulation protein K
MSALCTLMPFIGAGIIVYGYISNFTPYYILGGGILIIGLFARKPLQELRVQARRDVEYDEFGLSKTKGKYEYLSKAERDQIDLQKTADMERVMNTSAMKKMTKKGSENPKEDMEKLIGLEPVKNKMEEMVARMQFESMSNTGKKKKKKDMSSNSMSGRHMVFYGAPGTGKTTVARIITGFLYQYGYIKENKCVEVDGNFLKAGADTSLKTELVIRQAYGGVLFVDEAYSLMDSADGSGREAIATLIKQMEDNRDRFILILAGYTNEMKYLLDANPGFESRIKEYLDFPDYNDEEMKEIFCLMAKENHFNVDEAALEPFTERIYKERQLSSFGNARTARNILDETMDKHAFNYVKGIIPRTAQYTICAEDVSRELKRNNFQ